MNIASRALEDGSFELDIFDAIGPQFWGITTTHVARLLKDAKGKPLNVRINSPGGDANTGVAIYNLFKSHDADVEIEVIGLAASAASVLMMGGTKVRIAETALVMVHEPWFPGGVSGNAEELRKLADLLDKDGAALAKAYVRRTGMDEDEVRRLMRAETWMTAQEAVDMGFADEIVEDMQAAACVKPSHLAIFKRELPKPARSFLAKSDGPSAISVEPVPTKDSLGEQPASRAPGPETDTKDKDITMPLPIALLTALSLAEDADEATVIAATKKLTAQAEVGREVEAVVGKTGSAAIGAVQALKQTSVAHAELQLKVQEVQTDLQRRDFNALVEKHTAPGKDRKLTPAVAKMYADRFESAGKDGRGKEVVEELRAFVEVAPTIAGTAFVQPENSGGADGLRWSGKTFAELEPRQRHALKKENPDLYDAMRQDAVAKGQL